MLNCIWNGKLIEAEQISKTEDSESSVRRASENHELKCTDPFCKCLICYKHGPKRSPHFAHIGESNCAYAAFEKNDTPIKRFVRSSLYSHFTNLGYTVKREIIIPNTRIYSDLMIVSNLKTYLLKITTSKTKAQETYNFDEACRNNEFIPLSITIGKISEKQFERHNYHAMRFQFNHNENNTLIIINEEANEISITKEDTFKYIYKGRNLQNRVNYDVHNLYFSSNIEDLELYNNELTLKGFYDEYNNWMLLKLKDYDKMIKDIDEYERKCKLNQIEVSKILSQKAEKYKIGMKVNHNNRGNGIVVNIKNKPNSSNHLIDIEFENKSTNQFELEVLLKNNSINIIE